MSAYPDVVVVVPGIMGSTLVDRHGNEVWGLKAKTLVGGLLTLARDVKQLQLPDGIGDKHPGDGVSPGSLIPDLHVIPGIWTISVGYSGLLDHLRKTHELHEYDPAAPDRPANLVPFAYDWRLSNRYTGRRLKSIVEPVLERWRAQPDHAGAKLVFVCHSMGGLVARWYLDNEGGAEHTRALITIGTPHRGAAMAVDRLVNGLKKGLGPISLNLSGVARSLPSLHQLLPEYACIVDGADLRKIDAGGLPGLASAMVADAVRFHEQLPAPQYPLRPILAFRHPTATTVRLTGSSAEMVYTIGGEDRRGDGTVPRLSAVPKGSAVAPHYVDETHTALPGNPPVLDQIDGILTETSVEYMAVEVPIGLSVDEIVVAGEPLTVYADVPDERRNIVLHARLVNAETKQSVHSPMRPAEGRYRATFEGQPPGAYTVTVGWGNPVRPNDPVTAAAVVLDPAELNAAAA